MRRGVVLVAGSCLALVLGGAAFAHPPTAAGGGAVAAAGRSVAAVDALRAAAAGDLERVGTTQTVTTSLGYPVGRRSVTLSYPGASYVKVHLSRLALPRGGYLTVSNPAGTEAYRYTTDLTDRWAMSIDGDVAVVTLAGPDAAIRAAAATIDRAARGFTRVEHEEQRRDEIGARNAAISAMRAGSRTESICGTDDSRDAVCYRSSDPVAYANSLPVARLLINGDELCSAWRVGPDNRMLTNHHCFTTTEDARSTEVWFGYACLICGTTVVAAPTKVWADQVLATDSTLDYTLFTVRDFASITGFGYLNLDVRDPAAGEQLYIPQHPGGAPTVIAMASDQDQGGNCRVDNPSAEGYAAGTDVAYYCDTAPGSSGSPVLSRVSNKVVALHHFGGCPNSGVRIDLIYRQIASLL